MATTKELLEKAMLKVGAHASAPTSSDTQVEISVDSTGTTSYYTPASDGYVWTSANTPSGKGFVAVATSTWMDAVEASETYAGNFLTPVGKGLPITFWGHNVKNMKAVFIKSIGGGGLGFLRKLLSVEVNYGYA